MRTAFFFLYLTDALGIYSFSDDRRMPAPSGSEQMFGSYDPAYPHTETRISPDRETFLLYSAGGFRILSAENGEILCDLQLPDRESVLSTEYLRNEGESCLKAVWSDGTVRCYDSSTGRLIRPSEATADFRAGEYLTDEYRRLICPCVPQGSVSRKSGTDKCMISTVFMQFHENHGGSSCFRQDICFLFSSARC